MDASISEYVILAGPFPGGVRTVVDETQKSFPETYQKKVDEHWDRVLTRHPSAFDGVVWGLQDLGEEQVPATSSDEQQAQCSADQKSDETQAGIVVTLRQSAYRHLLCSHFPPPEILEHENYRDHNIRALGVSALTFAADGALILGKRRAASPAMPNYWHFLPAGNMCRPDANLLLAEEMREELGIDLANTSHVTSVLCLGVAHGGDECGDKPELTWRIRTAFSRQQLEESFRSAKDAHEHDSIAFVGPDHEAIRAFMRDNLCTQILKVFLELHMATEVSGQP